MDQCCQRLIQCIVSIVHSVTNSWHLTLSAGYPSLLNISFVDQDSEFIRQGQE
jgi:hypothetical protein